MSAFRAEAEAVHATLDDIARPVYVTRFGRVVGPQTACWSKRPRLAGMFNRAITLDDFTDECRHTLAELRKQRK